MHNIRRTVPVTDDPEENLIISLKPLWSCYERNQRKSLFVRAGNEGTCLTTR